MRRFAMILATLISVGCSTTEQLPDAAAPQVPYISEEEIETARERVGFDFHLPTYVPDGLDFLGLEVDTQAPWNTSARMTFTKANSEELRLVFYAGQATTQDGEPISTRPDWGSLESGEQERFSIITLNTATGPIEAALYPDQFIYPGLWVPGEYNPKSITWNVPTPDGNFIQYALAVADFELTDEELIRMAESVYVEDVSP